MNPSKARNAKLEAGIFWPSKNLNRQWEFLHSKLLHFFHPSTGLWVALEAIFLQFDHPKSLVHSTYLHRLDQHVLYAVVWSRGKWDSVKARPKVLTWFCSWFLYLLSTSSLLELVLSQLFCSSCQTFNLHSILLEWWASWRSLFKVWTF